MEDTMNMEDEAVSSTTRLNFSRKDTNNLVHTPVDPEEDIIEDTDPESDEQTYSSTKTVLELAAERARLDAEIKAKQDAEKASVIAQIKNVVEAYAVPIDELVEALGGFKRKRKGSKAKQKFRDPRSGATWSGRGKEPAWIKGKNKNNFLISNDDQE